MKLPENKKERVQILVFGVILGVGIFYAAVAFGIRPMIKARKERKAGMEQLQTKIKEAQEYLEVTADNAGKNHEFLSNIEAFSETHFLKPRLGDNYALGVGEMVEDWARESGLKLAAPGEIGRTDLPHAEGARSVVRAYAFNINPKCGLQDLVRLLQFIENRNPAMAVIHLSILPNSGDPLNHTITLSMHTPIWANHHEMTARLASDLDAASKARKTRRHEGH
ncbi:MAG: hypothetical protein QME60_06625 [Verrucomicrobiota bacterium]|nr:hypothetical protein [Verrucomicrobiota bacterium]